MIDSVKIGYRRYAVHEVDASELADNGRKGEIVFRTGEIRIADNLPQDNAAEVVVHEILHGLFHDLGVDWSAEDEERMVERLSPRLAALFVDNPQEVAEIVRMLQADE